MSRDLCVCRYAGSPGGIETYIDALVRTLRAEQRQLRSAASLGGRVPLFNHWLELSPQPRCSWGASYPHGPTSSGPLR